MRSKPVVGGVGSRVPAGAGSAVDSPTETRTESRSASEPPRCGMVNDLMRSRIVCVKMESGNEDHTMTPQQAKKLGSYLRRHREGRQLSTRQLGDLVDVPNSTIVRLERGENLVPRPNLLSDIAEALRLELADLYAMADYAVPSDLPHLSPYLRTKYRDLSEGDVRAISVYAAKVAKQRGVDLTGPAPGEDEVPETRTKRTAKARTKGGIS